MGEGSLKPCMGTALGVSVALLAVYLYSLSPSFGFVDKGELAAVAATLGIAHPTGYPTILLLGHLATRLLPLREVMALNVMAAFFGAASGGALTLCFYHVLRRLHEAEATDSTWSKGKPARGDVREGRLRCLSPADLRRLAAAGALFTALTATWWSQANGFEVYCLHLLMIPLLTWLFLRYLEGRQEEGEKALSRRRGAGFAFILGLSFTNHMSTILLAPAFITYFFCTVGLHRRLLQRLAGLAAAFVVGLLPYLWLPLRAAMKPRFNWGDPSTWEGFLAHVTGRQYRVWMFTNPESFRQQTAFFFGNLPREVGFVGLLLAVAGIFELAGRKRLAFWSLLLSGFWPFYLWTFAGEYGLWPFVVVIAAAWVLGLRWSMLIGSLRARLSLFATLLFVTAVVYASGYDIMEIRPYYLTAVFAVGLWATVGLYGWARRHGGTVALAGGCLLVGLTGIANFAECDERSDTLVEDMARDVLCYLPEDAIVLSAQWDFWVSGSWYLQAVEGLRTDVAVMDPELLRRSWYLDQLSRAYPDIMGSVKPEEARFRRELYKFEHDLPYDSAVIDSSYRALIDAVIDRHVDSRPVFVTAEVEPRFGARYLRVPYYLTLRLMKDPSYLRQEFPRYRYLGSTRPIDVYTLKQAELYAASAYARVAYEMQFGHRELADRYLDLALSYAPAQRPERLRPQPLDGNQRVAATLQWFDALRRLRPGELP